MIVRAILQSAALLFFVSACANAQDNAEMMELGSALTKVARAVDTAANSSQYQNLDGNELLQVSVQRDPSLLEPFRGYVLKVRRLGGASAVLVCDKDGDYALLEDSGCTARLDKQRFQQQERCEFSLPLQQICN